jgi:biopolymer transport protein ExbD
MSAAVVVAGIMAFALAGCTPKPDPVREPPAEAGGPPPSSAETTRSVPPDAGIALPSLDGLGLTDIGPPDDGPAYAGKWLRKITVDIPAEGAPRVTDVRDASRWRGIALPRFEGQHPIPKAPRPGVPVRVAADGTIRLGRFGATSMGNLQEMLGKVLARDPDLPLVFDAEGVVPWGVAVKAAAIAIEEQPGLHFMAPSLVGSQAELRTLRERIQLGLGGRAPEALGVFLAEADPRYEKRAPNACVRIQADAGAPYASVQRAMVAAMMNYVWRVSFVGTLDGREVEIGIVYDTPDDPPAKPPILDMGPPEFEDLEFETEDKISEVPLRAENEIDDIPLGNGTRGVPPSGVRPRVIAYSGGPGPYGFRTGGGRRRAAVRNGGSAATERCVADAHAWLARNQGPDGRWSSAKFGGREGLDVAVTGLATLSLLGAGQTENRIRRHREVVRKAVAWLVANQTEEGCLADHAAKRAGRTGTSHAIAAQALAEAFGMARLRATGRAAQRAVDYSTAVHQPPYSGWGERPKGAPDTLVTGWFTAQLKSAKIAGLRVEGASFQGSIAWLDKVTDLPRRDVEERVGAARVRPGLDPTPTATAVATFARQIMGWKRKDPLIVGGSDYVLAHLLGSEARELDHEFLYWGSLAMFQMGNERWKTWNRRVRDMLIHRQRTGTGDPALDGSWDPVAADAELGRVGATALASMCLEVYYRYLPLYNESGRTR